MEKSYSRPKLPGSARMRRRGLARMLLAVAVLVAVPIVLLSLFSQEAKIRFNGVVESGAENVGPVEASRIIAIEVKQGQRVKKGDVLVRFDPTERLRDDSVNAVKIKEYEQNLAKRRETLSDSERKCRQLVREAEVHLEECRMARVRDQSELDGYEAEIKRLKPLVEKKLVSELELLTLRPKAAALAKIVSQYEPLEAALVRRFKAAEEDLASVIAEKAAAEKDINVAADAVRDANLRSDELKDADPSVLRALQDGIVTMVFRHAGDIVAAGEPVLRISAETDGAYVTGMLPASMLDAVHTGDTLYITRFTVVASGQTPAPVAGVVEAIDSEVLDLFDPINPAPRVPVRGRKMRIRVTGDSTAFVPGEAVLLTDTAPGAFGDFLSFGSKGEEK